MKVRTSVGVCFNRLLVLLCKNFKFCFILTVSLGTFVTCLKQCNNSAQQLLQLIVTEFPCFNDGAVYHGTKGSYFERSYVQQRKNGFIN